MLCSHCRKKIMNQRHLWNLFHVETMNLCERCYAKYPLLPTYEVVPITSGIAHVWTLSKLRYPVLPYGYQAFLKTYYQIYLKSHQKMSIMLFDEISDVMWDLIDELSFGDLFIVRHYENSHDKGEKL